MGQPNRLAGAGGIGAGADSGCRDGFDPECERERSRRGKDGVFAGAEHHRGHFHWHPGGQRHSAGEAWHAGFAGEGGASAKFQPRRATAEANSGQCVGATGDEQCDWNCVSCRGVWNFISLSFKAIVIILHWVLDLVPLAVLCTVAENVGTKGFGSFLKLGWFIVAVLVALSLQAVWYLVRIRFGSWVRPKQVLLGMRDALVMAFSTSSSTATMPVTYACLRDKVGLREDSASMGALVGSNFNNDGTALYEAMAALFIAQMIGVDLSFQKQLIVVLMAIVASVGAAGIPEAGLITMTLVFKAVGLPEKYIFLLLPVDWFLDRCRTTINVLGDVNVACLLEGRHKTEQTGPAEIQDSGRPDESPLNTAAQVPTAKAID
jgi:hypothetical protein